MSVDSRPIGGTRQLDGLERTTRVLITIAPRSYREALALAIHRYRQPAEVRIAPPGDLVREVDHFRPHLVVCNEATEQMLGSVPSWVEILFHDSLDANVRVDEKRTRKIEDIGIDDLLEVFDETEELLTSAQ